MKRNNKHTNGHEREQVKRKGTNSRDKNYQQK